MKKRPSLSLLAVLIIVLLVSACTSGSQQTATPADQPTATMPAVATATTPAKPTTSPTETGATPPAASAATPKTATQPAGTAAGAVPAGQFVDPVISTNFPDPFLLKVGDTWYAYATNGSGRNVQVATSKDLVHWGNFADAMPVLAGWTKLTTIDVWAPEVLSLNEKYILYYTARDKQSGKQCVGAAVSDKPEGKFRDPNKQALVCQKQEGGTIDPSPFRDGDKLYLLYKNDGNCCGMPTYIYSQELAPDGLTLKGEPKRLVRNDAPWEGGVVEAPTMMKHDERYYLFFSANGYAGPEYAVGYATCDSPMGSCTDAPENPILKSRLNERPFVVGPGHQTIVQVGDQYWIVYHAWQILESGIRSQNRFMYLDRLNWKDGKPVVAGPTIGPEPIPQP